MNHQFREEILEILRFRGVSAILIFERKRTREIQLSSALDRHRDHFVSRLDIDF